nr:SDR family NAD(P)-dependent oxidoreductase [Paenibacillus xylanexedens]
MKKVQKYIYSQVAEHRLQQGEAKEMLLELQQHAKNPVEDIAIIGISGKFPGSENVDEYWNHLKNGVSLIGEFPDHRKEDAMSFLSNEFSSALITGGTEKVLNPKNLFGIGGFLKEIDKFDAGFFKISPKEATYMDPLQRLFLETAWEAIEDAGYGGERIVGTNTAVIVGKDHTPLPLYRMVTEQDPLHLTGSWSGLLPSRVSYLLNLRGPSLVVDTSCSSGLVALHQACQSLRAKTCEMALVGGIHISVVEVNDESKDGLNMVKSSDNMVKTFDKKADGTVWGEAVVALLIKPLSKALSDGDSIHAVIKGSATNSDGASNGITAPNAKAQEEVILKAWKDARVSPESISYIEAHGTGTVLGDPIEVKGLTNAFGKFTDKKQFCAIGSVKTNIGHTVGASGLASLIKVVMSLKHKAIPASLHFEEPNPYIPYSETPLYVNDRFAEWKVEEQGIRRAGVSSFGFSGTNCHVVLEEAPIGKEERSEEPSCYLLMVSAKNPTTLNELVHRYESLLSGPALSSLADVCYTATTGRGHYKHRIAIVGDSQANLHKKLKEIKNKGVAGLEAEGIYYGEHYIVPDTRKALLSNQLTEKMRRDFGYQADQLAGSLSLASSDYSYRISKIAELYVKGGEVNGELLYLNQKRKRVRIPVHPLERIRYWAEPGKHFLLETDRRMQFNLHELLMTKSRQTLNEDYYETILSSESYWMLDEHRYNGLCVMPGVTYLEWFRAVCLQYFTGSVIELRGIVILSPLFVRDGEFKRVQTVVRRCDGHLEMQIVSGKEGADSTWIIHAEAKGYDRKNRSEANVVVEQPVLLNMAVDLGNTAASANLFNFGSRWNNIVNVKKAGHEFLVELKLQDRYKKDFEKFDLHPAMLDNALNVPIHLEMSQTYVPFAFKSVLMFGSISQHLFSHIRGVDNSTERSDQSKSFDVNLHEPSGRVVAKIERYTIKKLKTEDYAKNLAKDEIGGRSYQIRWYEAPITSCRQKNLKDSVLLLSSLDPRIKSSANQIKRIKSDSQIVTAYIGGDFNQSDSLNFTIRNLEEDYINLLQTVKKTFTQIIYLLPLDCDEGAFECLHSLFYLTRALVGLRYTEQIDLVLVGEGVNAVFNEIEVLNPEASAAFAMAKVIEQEHAWIRCRCIDVESHSQQEGEWLQELLQDNSNINGNLQVAYRNGKRYLSEFTEISAPDARRLSFNEGSGVYVITGGLGGIGREITKYLANQSRTPIALITRSPLPPMDEWDMIAGSENSEFAQAILMLLELNKSGFEVDVYQADLSDSEKTQKAIQAIKEKHGSIRGVIHCSGVAGQGLIINKNLHSFRSVLSSKAKAVINLDKALEDEKPDFFVLCSSLAALTGGLGQADYAAANAYLDAFARKRSAAGKPTVSINWPSWRDTGMAVRYKVDLDNGFLEAVRTEEALKWLEIALSWGESTLIPGNLNYKALTALDSEDVNLPLSSEIKLNVKKAREKKINAKITGHPNREVPTKTLKKLIGKTKEEYTSTEMQVAVLWAETLGMDQVDIYESFYDSGGDSILAVSLVRKISEAWNWDIDLSLILDHPTIYGFSEYLDTAHPELAKRMKTELNIHLPQLEVPEPFPKEIRLPINQSLINQINGFSWRELNCFDRGLVFQVGLYNEQKARLFKLLIGLKRGYQINEAGYEYRYQDQHTIFGYKLDESALNLMGYRHRLHSFGSFESLQQGIKHCLQREQAVIIPFDEFFTFYTPYYGKEHTNHLTIVTGYCDERQLYTIVNHNHIIQPSLDKFDYGTFTVPYQTLEDIYAYLSEDQQCILTVEPINQDEHSYLSEEQIFNVLERFLPGQAGAELDTLLQICSKKEQNLDQENMRELYVNLGGKELLLQTLLDCSSRTSQELCKLQTTIIERSEKMLLEYVTSLYRKKSLELKKVVAVHDEISDYSRRFLELILNDREIGGTIDD